MNILKYISLQNNLKFSIYASHFLKFRLININVATKNILCYLLPMKILVTIPHYYNADSASIHGSGKKDPIPRIQALSMCLYSLHSLFGGSQCMLNIVDKTAIPVNQNCEHEIDVVICTANSKNLLEHLNVPKEFFKQSESTLDNPKYLGFECQKVLKENLGKYDYYCFMEDDLIINDSLFFEKLNWFNQGTEDTNLLLPNRYETSSRGNVLKAYVDGDINPRATEKYQNVKEFSHLHCKFLNQNVVFQRPLNPHSGCYFLTQKQMEHWSNQPHFLDLDAGFISPLESSATLGIMKTFRIYKPIPQNANFLEIQHFGDAFLRLIGNKIKLKTNEQQN